MFNIASRITGVAFLIILFLKGNSIPAEKISGCDIFKDPYGRLKGDCSGKGISKIPTNLDSGLEILDVSNNIAITHLENDDLKNYPNLWALNIGNLSIAEFPEGYFQYTSKIKLLNISRTQIKNLKEISASITILNYTFSQSEYIDVSHLIYLEKLFLRFSTKLKKFPTISTLAPLQVLDVRNCSLIEADYAQVAPFCKLVYLGINSTDLAKDQYVKQCCALRKWGISWRITGTRNQNCSRLTHPPCRTLNLQLDAQSINLFKQCYFEDGLKKFIILMAIVMVCVIWIVAAIIASTWYYYHHFNISFWDPYKPKSSLAYSLNSLEVEVETEID